MKHTFRLFLILCCIVASAACKPRRQLAMEYFLKQELKAPSTYRSISFDLADEITLADELKERIEYFERKRDEYRRMMEHDSSMAAHYRHMAARYDRAYRIDAESYERQYGDHKGLYEDNLRVIESLNAIEPDSTKVTFREYKLCYEAANSYGATIVDVCTGRYNSEGFLVAIRPAVEASWNILGDFFSIPGYYDIISGGSK